MDYSCTFVATCTCTCTYNRSWIFPAGNSGLFWLWTPTSHQHVCTYIYVYVLYIIIYMYRHVHVHVRTYVLYLYIPVYKVTCRCTCTCMYACEWECDAVGGQITYSDRAHQTKWPDSENRWALGNTHTHTLLVSQLPHLCRIFTPCVIHAQKLCINTTSDLMKEISECCVWLLTGH